MQIVNQILDTLNDNDFVNVYVFTNTTEPLVDCFNDTLVQVPFYLNFRTCLSYHSCNIFLL